MPIADLGNVQLNYRIDGPIDGAPLVLANSLATTLAIWDDVVAALPANLRILRFDMRGHGGSSVPPAPYSMGSLIRDTERLLDFCEIQEAVFVGISLGGIIGQGLAVKRMDQIRALVLSNTAAKVGTPDIWQQRIQAVADKDLSTIGAATMDRWFPAPFRNSAACKRWQEMFETQPLEGYLGCCAAIAGTDFYTPTSGLRLPTLGIAGSHDKSTPPDLVRETTDLVPGSRFKLIKNTGHLPCIDQPQAYAEIITSFLQDTGHISVATL